MPNFATTHNDVRGFQEQLFVSKKSVFDGRKPIRGGIPFIFPQFGQWNYGMNGPPYHGFARISKWALEKGPERMPSGDIEAIFSLSDSDFTYSMWQHHFKISYRIILREKELHLNIGVYNPSKDGSFDFNVMLHSYFKCPDVRRCQADMRAMLCLSLFCMRIQKIPSLSSKMGVSVIALSSIAHMSGAR